MTQLTTKLVSLPIISMPVQQVQFVKPLSYQFRVAETVDNTSKITKVSLQMQVLEHDEYGSGIVKQFWQDVPRIKLDETGDLIP